MLYPEEHSQYRGKNQSRHKYHEESPVRDNVGQYHHSERHGNRDNSVRYGYQNCGPNRRHQQRNTPTYQNERHAHLSKYKDQQYRDHNVRQPSEDKFAYSDSDNEEYQSNKRYQSRTDTNRYQQSKEQMYDKFECFRSKTTGMTDDKAGWTETNPAGMESSGPKHMSTTQDDRTITRAQVLPGSTVRQFVRRTRGTRKVQLSLDVTRTSTPKKLLEDKETS